MGTGISGAILLEFEIEPEYKSRLLENSVNGFLENYESLPKKEKSRNEYYKIKDDVLLTNYVDFLTEFYNLIDDDLNYLYSSSNKEPVEEYIKKLLLCKTREEFDDIFKSGNHHSGTSYISSKSLSCMYCDRNKPFLFYNGSYKAYLEEYTTLVHMERMIQKAMINPLKNAVKFGIYE